MEVPTPVAQSAYEQLSPKPRRFVDLYVTNGFNATRAYEDAGYKPSRGNAARMIANERVAAAVRERLTARGMGSEEVLARLSDEAAATAEDFVRFDTVRERQTIYIPVSEAIARLRASIEDEEKYATLAQLEEGDLEDSKARVARIRRQIIRHQVDQERDPDKLVPVDGPLVVHRVPVLDLAKAKRRGKLHLVKALKYDRQGRLQVELHDAQAAKRLIGQKHGMFKEGIDLTSGGKPISRLEVVIPDTATE